MQHIPLEQILASVDNRYAYGDTSAWPRWKDWAYQAESSIGPIRANIKNSFFPLVGGRVEKPRGYLWCEDFALTSLPDTPTAETDANVFALNSPLPSCQLVYPIYRGDTFHSACNTGSRNSRRITGNGTVNYGGLTYSESDTHFFVDNVGTSGINAAFLAYMAQPLDDNGDLKIPETHERAVIAYITWQEDERRANQYPNLVGAGKLERAERLWGTLKMNARGRDNMPDAAQMREIAARSLSLIQKSSRSRDYDYKSNGRF